MVYETWSDIFAQSLRSVWGGVATYLPNLIVAIVIFIIGWIVGALIGKVVEQVIKALRIDSALKNTQIDRTMIRSGYSLNVGAFLGGLVKWFVIVVFLLAVLDILGLRQVTAFLQDVVLTYLPQVIVAVLILVVAAVVAEVTERTVTGSARAANLRHAAFLGTVTRWAIWTFAILAALSQLGIAGPFVQTLFTGIIIAVSLAVGLSFGLGGQDAARDYVNKIRKELPND